LGRTSLASSRKLHRQSSTDIELQCKSTRQAHALGAALAGISASNPFPPLPAGFRGDQIRLQLSFFYNLPVQ